MISEALPFATNGELSTDKAPLAETSARRNSTCAANHDGRGKRLLWWGVLDELDALFDVALESADASLEKLLLLIGHAVKNVDSFLRAVGLYP